MKHQVDHFAALHHQTDPLLIGNVWNAQSAQVFQKLEFKAIATSSAAIAATLGYPDGEAMSFAEYFQVIKSITRVATLPLSVDLEGGYGKDVEEIVDNVRQLATVGIVGINIEDSSVVNGTRSIEDAAAFAIKLKTVIEKLKASNTKMFVNVRCDVFLLGISDTRNQAVQRAKLYGSTGAHGLFFPCVTSIGDIDAIVQATALPVNVMCMPGLPTFKELKDAGVKRISMGNFLHAQAYQLFEEKAMKVVSEGSFQTLFS